MRIGICAEEKEECIKVENILREGMLLNSEYDTIQFYSLNDVKINLEENLFQCDVMVMDIDFKQENLNGIRLSKLINEKAPDCQIVYLAHKFIADVYETEHCYLVIKDNMQVMLPRAVKKAKYLYGKAVGKKMVELISGGHIVYIAQKDIVYIKKENRVIHVCTRNRVYDSYQSLAEIGRQLDEELVRCHGSYVINLKYVTELGKSSFIMEDEKEIPIGKTYLNQMKKEYFRYRAEKKK
ncbi:MAG: LytR/AlgR family response regulator transcription factor [Lachnospiraceae bacterium]